MRKLSGSVVLTAVALSLVACGGGATVDNQGQTTVAPLTKQPLNSSENPTASASASASASAKPTASSTPQRDGAGQGGAAAPAPKDQPAQEVSSVPDPGDNYDQREKRYLDELQKQGIKVDGVEDQMLGAAEQVCSSPPEQPNYLVGAIAGQLVEQHRTDKQPQEVTDVIAQAAKGAYC